MGGLTPCRAVGAGWLVGCTAGRWLPHSRKRPGATRCELPQINDAQAWMLGLLALACLGPIWSAAKARTMKRWIVLILLVAGCVPLSAFGPVITRGDQQVTHRQPTEGTPP